MSAVPTPPANSSCLVPHPVTRARNLRSRVLQFRIDVSASAPFCKRALRALYALANSNRSAPPPVSRAQKHRLQGSLSLTLSNLSSTNSKASGPTRTSPEKGCSKRSEEHTSELQSRQYL